MIVPRHTHNTERERSGYIIPVLRKAVFRWNNSLSLIKITNSRAALNFIRAAAF